MGDLVRCAVAVAGVLVFFTGFDNYAFLTHSGPKPLLWILAFVGAAAALSVLTPRRPMPLLRSPLLAWAFFFFFLTTLWGVSASNEAAVQSLTDRYRSLTVMLAFAVLFGDPRVRRLGALAIIVAVALASLVNLAETAGLLQFGLIDASELQRTAGRAGGLYINPNRSGVAIAVGLAVSATAVPRALRLPLVLLAAAGTAATFSRSALICVAIIVLSLLWRRAIDFWPAVLSSAVIAVLVATLASDLVYFLDAQGLLNSDTAARLAFEADDSGRVEVAAKAWGMFRASPLVGNGLGSTQLWDTAVSSHNMYLELASDHGVLGLLVFPALILSLVLTQRRITPLALTLLVAGVFSHNLFDEGAPLIAIALSASGEVGMDEAEAEPPGRDMVAEEPYGA